MELQELGYSEISFPWEILNKARQMPRYCPPFIANSMFSIGRVIPSSAGVANLLGIGKVMIICFPWSNRPHPPGISYSLINTRSREMVSQTKLLKIRLLRV